ncbi:MAG: 3-isopropylmalate dehydratase large subunit [Deltaproteobacteria bacterium]|jgi:3-isopropylmalate/(R)-2-methylmalate dehydratase large subunit|nr:3-isopropylmalate dehydratase large subunit [Deltaproteobacteria bacterium]
MTCLLDRLWESHLVRRRKGYPDLLYIDRHLVHEVTSNQAFEGLRAVGRKLRRPELTCGVIDHSIPTKDRTRPLEDPRAEAQLAALERNSREFGLKAFFGDEDPRQGVIHVCMPEQGLILPGHSVVCGDSHTATHGAFGALAFGIGTSEVEHVMATQTLQQLKPKSMVVDVRGGMPKTASAKDLILNIIRKIGVGGGAGRAIEYRWETVRALSMESRMTLCNMSIECGARLGMVAPDEVTFSYLKGRPYAPAGKAFDKAVERWKRLKSDDGHPFDASLSVNVVRLSSRVTWGTNPAQNVPASGKVPCVDTLKTVAERKSARQALDYMKLEAGLRLEDVEVNYVFIGSCTNGRYEDLKQAAAVLKSRKVAKGVRVLVVPGSGPVKRRCEEEGLDRVFLKAGCEWRHPGCSMCLAMNPDIVPPGNRCVSTSNRNFQGRQGRLAMTHLASPVTAAASAIAGRIIALKNIRRYL